MTDRDELVALATQLVCRVRDVDPQRNHLWLSSLTNEQRYEMLFVLAAMVDPNAPVKVTLGWTFPLADAANDVARERFGHVMPPDLPRRRAAS